VKRLSPLLLLLVLLVSACGSGRLSDDEYRGRISNINTDLTNASSAIAGTAAPRVPVTRIRASLGRLADSQDRIAATVEDIKPPKKAEAANALLAKGARDLSAELRGTQRALRGESSHTKAIALVRQNLGKSKGVKELSDAFDQLHRLGYFR
jgi:hypothetical protein